MSKSKTTKLHIEKEREERKSLVKMKARKVLQAERHLHCRLHCTTKLVKRRAEMNELQRVDQFRVKEACVKRTIL